MWPGQQPPGGEQNPQDQNPNPYQQPGYQQPGYPQQNPNPYQQPGYQQQPGYPPPQPGYPQQGGPNPYQQQTAPQYAVPGPGGSGPGGGKKKSTAVVAVVAAMAVVVTAAVTGYLVLGQDDDTDDKAGGDPTASASKKPGARTTTSPPAANPRDGSTAAKPQIAGWKVVSNPKYGTQFDVPPDWEVEKPGITTFWEDEKKGDGTPLFSFSAPAFYKSKWCSQDSDKDGTTEDSSLAGTGTKGAKGAKDVGSASVIQANNLVWAAYAQKEPPNTVKTSKATPFTTTSGIKGSYATATAEGVKKSSKCSSDGKAISFTFLNARGEYAAWMLFANKNVPDEVPDETLMKIMATVRQAGVS